MSHVHASHDDPRAHIASMGYCLKQVSRAHELDAKGLYDLACDLEHCNTELVSWIAEQSVAKGYQTVSHRRK